MLRRTRVTRFVLATCLCVAVGCGGRSPFRLLGARDAGYPGGNQSVAAVGQADGQKKPTLGGQGIGQPPRAEDKTVYGSMTSAFRQVSAQVTGAFTRDEEPSEVTDSALRVSGEQPQVSSDVYLRAAQLLESRGDLDAATVQYRKALDKSPKDRRALLGLGRLYDRQGDFARAIPIYQQAVDAHPNDAAAYNSLGLCYARHGQVQKSIELLQRAVKLQPKVVLHRNNLATVLVEAGRSDEALKQLLAVHPADIAHYNLGFLLNERGDRDLAVHHLRLAIEKNPLLAPARRMLEELAGPPASEKPKRVPASDDSQFDPSASSKAPANRDIIRLPDTRKPHRHDEEADTPPSPDYFEGDDRFTEASTRNLPPVVERN